MESSRYTKRFHGRLVLVTGAGSGIGRATAGAFATAGARVVCVDRNARTASDSTDLAKVLGATDAWPEAVDITDAAAMERLAERVLDAHGVVDILVNSAGIGMSGRFLDTSVADWRRTLDVNLWGVIHGCRLFGRQMADRGQGGHIVTIASAAAFQPTRAVPVYATSKAAVVMLSECLRAELAQFGVGVSAVCPGFVNTSFTAAMHFAGVSEQEQVRLRKRAVDTLGRRGCPPERVAAAVLRAVARNTPVAAVTPDARLVRLIGRFAPPLRRAVARLDPPS
ncbi:MAG: SDR family NAD(P)-dependent oxidoreductase [Streptomyces sp.]|nr:SDR family NAD(P)-dependent oxidoreductase [Streptomyces sp.]